ncbi:MAG: biotin synthase BioB [Syntrophobacteraceae bacterium]|nr:biotin synthase BioB [Syntrophobacteraceae bacterium]
MGNPEVKAIRRAAENGEPLPDGAAFHILRSPVTELPEIFAAASMVRRRYFGNTVGLCSIFSAQSGACSEDCAFCAQASCHNTDTSFHPLCSREEMAQAFEEAAQLPLTHFGVVTSGCALSSEGVERVCGVIEEKRHARLGWCASFGCLDYDQLLRLKAAGLKRFHHNLETAPSFFPQICSTHSYDIRLETVRNAKRAGLEVCCGGIFGLGETAEQRVEFARLLARETIESIPLNFLIPIPGTRLEKVKTLKPLDILRIVSMFRLTNPGAEVRVCAGRVHLGDLQSMIFLAGANSMMIGRLLTVAGQGVDRDLKMLEDLEVDYEL